MNILIMKNNIHSKLSVEKVQTCRITSRRMSLITLSEIVSVRSFLFSQENNIKIIRTPTLVDVQHKNKRMTDTGAIVSLKLENLQTLGSFKTRGVANVIRTVTREPNTKLVTMSAGNFGRSFAYAVQKNGLSGTVVMPETVPKDRVQFIESCGLKVELVPVAEVKDRTNSHVSNYGAVLVHPFDDKNLFVGYGSIGLEILEDVPNIDVIVVPIGGGGLISGILSAVKLSKYGKDIRVVGVEPEGASKMYQSLQKGEIVSIKPSTYLHGLAAPFPGQHTFHHVKEFGAEVVLITDEEAKQAMNILFNDYKLVVEGSGAASVAALLSGKLGDVKGKNVVCVLSGGNVDIKEFVDLVPTTQ